MTGYAVLDRVGFRELMRGLYRVEVVGSENVPATGGVILASNHESVVDPFILAVATLREIRYMTKAELFRIPPVASTLRWLGAFPVVRGSADRQAFGEAFDLLRRGEVLGIFPQGTSKQHRDRRWRSGAARLALATGAPIVPVRMTGTRAWPLRTRVRIHVGPPIAVEATTPTAEAATTLIQLVEQGVQAA